MKLFYILSADLVFRMLAKGSGVKDAVKAFAEGYGMTGGVMVSPLVVTVINRLVKAGLLIVMASAQQQAQLERRTQALQARQARPG